MLEVRCCSKIRGIKAEKYNVYIYINLKRNISNNPNGAE